MLLWEYLGVTVRAKTEQRPTSEVAPQIRRLPYDLRCSSVTKSGRRCRGRVLPGKECCVFHDPQTAAKRQASVRRSLKRTRLARLPDGYLRKITDRRAVGQAMDRLYREIRLGIITPEMGRVLFDVLTRLLDSGLADLKVAPRSPGRSKAARMRPKVSEVLTRAERRAWHKAVAVAPASFVEDDAPPAERRVVEPSTTAVASNTERALTIPLQAAS